ncbi:unnamed protein product [Brassicogethes aeneus]|uniref:oxaloacetate tautomerase n=1 Tax=Brassicogethes aeneus TaxID=1431903 RepID=A0A9P0B826_BRAAE|nr:unnamed protein product [Brassicogethes aeneus]
MTNLHDFAKNGRKIIGIAANYHELLKILKKPVPKKPGIFIKASTSYLVEGEEIWIPKEFSVNQEVELGVIIGKEGKFIDECQAMDYIGGYCASLDMTATCQMIPKEFSVNQEVELGVIIGKEGKFIDECQAMDYIGGYCASLDMTATCQMQEARSTGGSWTLGKSFDTACPVSKFIPKSKVRDPHNIELWCSVNSKERQRGNTDDLVFKVPFLISYISQYMTLQPNDLIITGSPPNMGPVHPGDVIEGGIKDVVDFRFCVAKNLS